MNGVGEKKERERKNRPRNQLQIKSYNFVTSSQATIQKTGGKLTKSYLARYTTSNMRYTYEYLINILFYSFAPNPFKHHVTILRDATMNDVGHFPALCIVVLPLELNCYIP